MEESGRTIAWWTEYEVPLKIAVIVVGAIVVNKMLRFALNRYFKRESARINVDPTAYNFLKNGVSFLILVIAFLNIIYAIPSFRQLAVTLFAGAGILAAIIGFASQTAFSNIMNGIMIVVFKPFRNGDIIEVDRQDAYMGVVEDITLRHTVIQNFENKRVIIPNSVISTQIIVNRDIADQKVVRFFHITVPFEANLERALSILREETLSHPLYLDPRTETQKAEGAPEVEVIVRYLSLDGAVIRTYLWAENSIKAWDLEMDMNRRIKLRFDEEGIPLAIPPRKVWMKP
jgi:small-conductance mechanosensitive channel